ncbi:ABC transporter permease [Rhodococcus wratislaviensis]|uniref:Putative ABC transporter permease protein n=1 Tax=Rhodococcus wratislaviensis NBRC 100605 TaxID=1219028 RepID=X0R806_RHOWR|nr:ABC transporter permease [Rhodococcus wratislaviensis]GAF47095.1 putative ABC transporter permease protein [Rhodococcus wratislaviensis NBRC 100605]
MNTIDSTSTKSINNSSTISKPPPERPSWASRLPRPTSDGFGRYGAVLALLVIMFLVLSITQDQFLTDQNIKNLLASVSVVSICACGMTFIILTAGLDLSIGATLALSGIFLAKVIEAGVPGAVAACLTVVFGFVVGGVLNGIPIGKWRLSFFVVTLGVASVLTGVVNIWSESKTTYVTSSFVDSVGFSNILGLPVPVWIMGACFALFAYVHKRTYFGRDLCAIGGNVEAARLTGINVAWTTVSVYAIAGACAGLASVVQTGRLGAASPLVGTDIALAAVAAVLLGGTTFTGGVGGIGGTVVGVLFVGVLQNGLGIAGVSGYWQQVITGAILVSAVGLDRLRQTGWSARLSRGSASGGDGSDAVITGGPPSAAATSDQLT